MKQVYSIVLIVTVLFTACSKKINVDAPTFDVQATNYRSMNGDTLVYNLSDTVKYTFSGYAGNVVLYNGTVGQNYDNRNRTLQLGTPILIFTNNAQFGTQPNTLQLLATSKLPGYDSASIVNAAWTDITSRAPLSTGSGAIGPDTVQLKDLVTSPNDSLFIAFKYTGVTGSTQRTWTITNFNVLNMLPAASFSPALNYNLSSLAADASYWKVTPKINGSTAAWTASTTSLAITGGTATAPNNVSWIVSKPLYPARVAPDVPTQIVQNVNSATQFGPFIPANPKPYTTAGIYKVTFVFFNNNVDDEKGSTKTFYIRINP